MRRFILAAILLLALPVLHGAIPHTHPWDMSGHMVGMPPIAAAQANDPDCQTLPIGAVAPAPEPVWCYDPQETGPATFTQGANSWLDEFNHGLSLSDLGAGYKIFDDASALYKVRHWRHNEHWMVDIAGQDADGPPPWNLGGSAMRPDRSFMFENGRLVVEADVAAGINEYQGNAWPEIVVTTAPAPTYARPTSTDIYVYDQFANFDTLGARLGHNGDIIVALWDNTERGPGQGGRVYEAQNFQTAGAAVHFGGDRQTPERAAASPICTGQDPDTTCRNRFRWEIEKNRWAFFVNGVRYMEFSGFPAEAQLPDRFVNSPVYVYFGERIFKPDDMVVRFHWDRLAVNPGTVGPPPVSTMTPTTTRVPASPTATATPTAQVVNCVAHFFWFGADTGRTQNAVDAACGH